MSFTIYQTALLNVMRDVILYVRMNTFDNNISLEQIHDLMDVIHNIPDFINPNKSNKLEIEYYVQAFQRFDEKWKNKDCPSLKLMELYNRYSN